MRWIQINTSSLRLLSPGARYLIGVSGGRDSVALLHWLVECGYNKLIVCHLNHQLRGRSSRVDAIFVKKLAAKYDVDLALGATDVRALAARTKQSIETAARDARYRFFAQVAKRRRCRTIFLGHHADDLVETLLINLFRGAGPGGLSAMRGVSVRKIDNIKLQIVRPLLGVSREQIDDYVRSHRLKFREDASNKNLAPLRNRIRHCIIPEIEKQLGRNVRGTIWRAATIAAEEENFFEALLPDKLSKLTALAVKPLRAMPIAVQRRILHEWLRARDVPDLSFDLVERVRALLDLGNRAAKTNLPQDRHVRRRAGQIFIE
ncbi:MAG TPA: tRNA lysidine(34) synthetase TilS [Chthoniobacterales bacterium]|jgi:tRNA(Ile)-lysidine synthase|nr:tRNA lysidine(34) synthetase TilS [Chthoniobacterales bacterium]